MSRHAKSLRVGGALAAALLVGCEADTTGLVTLTVPELATLLEGESGPVLCDANSPKTRARHGVIPGALLLSNYRDYEPGAELPADKGRKLVFYCHSEMCGAAVGAARKAIAGGYTDVAVLPAGIRGWSRAERPIDKPSAS